MDDLKWLVSSLSVLAGLAFGFWRYREDRRKQLLVDLQGDKDAVAAVAMRVWRGRFPKRPRPFARRRFELFEALCLAAVFESSGRSRSLIYGALAQAVRGDEYRTEIKETVDRISMSLSRTGGYTDLARARRRLIALRAALRLDEEVRLRLDTLELDGYTRDGEWPPDQRLRHDAFGWADLMGAVRLVGNLVVVGSTEPLCAVIALDHHRACPKTGNAGRKRFQTRASKEFCTGKYGEPSARRVQATDSLAKQLAAVVNRHGAYDRATYLAGVPGSEHDFSRTLAVSVAKKANKTFVSLAQTSDATIEEGPRFTVADPTPLKGQVVIVVDDVYRSGRTLRAAAAALRKAGAEEVLGLTATCTISPTAQPCAHGGDDKDEG